MLKLMSALITSIALCAPVLADNTDPNKPQPKGKRPAVSFGNRDIQTGSDQVVMKKPAPVAAPAATTKPAKKEPSVKNY